MPSPSSRRDAITRLRRDPFDVLIIGGGINGAGVARDLALRNQEGLGDLHIALVEQGHFASATSGKNSQLIHGGLRYLKNLEFRLVREALHERSILLKIAPHLVEPLPFLIPMYSRIDRLVYSTGLWIYDALAGARQISPHSRLSTAQLLAIEPGLSPAGLAGGSAFYDCRVHSARLVLENVFDAIAHSVAAANYVRAIEWRKKTDGWGVALEDVLSGEKWTARAKIVVNATGAWSDSMPLRLVRGSHIIVPRVNQSDHAIAYFEPAGRIVFFIPWGSRRQLTLIGTTDVDHTTGPDNVRISAEEVEYLRGIAARVFPASRDVAPVSAFSSLRPLLRDESASPTSTSREHRISTDADGTVHIAGGKYTTYRLMSEQAADLVTAAVAPSLRDVHLTAERALPQTPEPSSPAGAARDEMAQSLRDYLFVSTYLGYEKRWAADELTALASSLGAELGWDAGRMHSEVAGVIQQMAIAEAAA